MNPYRLALLGIGLLALLAAGYVAAVAGMWLCEPPPLPGDAWWAWRTRLSGALALLLGGGRSLCFLDTPPGALLLGAARWTTTAVAGLALAIAAWELAGVRIRQRLLGRWGGHAILAGDSRPLERLAGSLGRRGGLLFLALDRDAARVHQRRHPFAEVAVLDDRAEAEPVLARLGIERARLLVAATRSDLANMALSEASIAMGSRAEILLRLEQPSVRAIGSQSLRRLATESQVVLTSLSLTQMQVRRGAEQAMPGRYVDEAARRIHVVVCGGGPGIQEAAFHIARQGYGLEHARPLMTILRTGHRDFAAGALDRLLAATDAVEVSVASADAADALTLDRAIAGAVLNGGPLTAVHCLGEQAGEAQALATRWERVMIDLDLPVPPIVAYGGRGLPGATGMIRIASRIDLAEASEAARIMDRRARLVHERYVEGQRRARGGAFGSLPAEVEWPLLGEGYQDDNRQVADHIGYKLALAGLKPGGRARDGASLDEALIDVLAPAEHARWTASKSVSGWRYGPKRDNDRLIHPDMKPYAALDADAQRKDREEVATLPGLLALSDEGVRRAFPVGAVLAADRTIAAEAIVAAARAWQAKHPDRFLLVRLPLDGAGPVALARALGAADIAVEVVLDRTLPAPLAGNAAMPTRAGAPAVMRGAERIRVVTGRSAREAIVAETPVLVDANGGLHADTLA